jgi:acid phosphatase type 7
MIKFSTNSTVKLSNFLKSVPTWSLLVRSHIGIFNSSAPLTSFQGNHEANCDNGSNLTICVPGQLNFTGYIAHWKYVNVHRSRPVHHQHIKSISNACLLVPSMPSQQSRGLGNFWYSFDYGMVHFITFNTETDFPNAPDEPGGEGAEVAGPFAPNGTQLAWLEKDLASVDRKKTPWIIVGGHRPWYVSTAECLECQAAFEPLFIKYGVDLVLHGHKHFYERQSAVANGVAQEIESNPTAPWYIVNGAGGHYDGLDTPTIPYVNTSRKVVVTYGWNLFTVHNCTHLTTEFIASGNGSVLDTATLFKNRKCNAG